MKGPAVEYFLARWAPWRFNDPMAVCKTCGHAMTEEQAKGSPFCPRCGVSHGAEAVPKPGAWDSWIYLLYAVAPLLAILLVILIKWWRGG